MRRWHSAKNGDEALKHTRSVLMVGLLMRGGTAAQDGSLRIDDARHESKFSIKEMVLRSQWELLQRHMEEQCK